VRYRVSLSRLCFGIALLGSSGQLHGGPVDSDHRPLVLMSYNILHSLNPLPPANWRSRRPLVWHVIRESVPDVLAMQEVLEGQLQDFEKEFGSDYAWVGRGHDGRMGGEILPVAWKRDRFELVSEDYFWLSPTPDVPGSRGWGGWFPRIVTWVRLRETGSGREFVVVNNHWEADNDLMDARRESARMLLERTAALPPDLPVFLVGDFNIVPTRERRRAPYRMLVEDGSPPVFTDAWPAAAERSGPDTTTNRLHPAPNLQDGERKDWILFRGPFQVRRVIVNDYHRDKIYPSDHLPVMAEFDW
jgi:endonuclease/exonuclease/phosphatase family metal-dependent hydrolase